jgi:hypothetical protein
MDELRDRILERLAKLDDERERLLAPVRGQVTAEEFELLRWLLKGDIEWAVELEAEERLSEARDIFEREQAWLDAQEWVEGKAEDLLRELGEAAADRAARLAVRIGRSRPQRIPRYINPLLPPDSPGADINAVARGALDRSRALVTARREWRRLTTTSSVRTMRSESRVGPRSGSRRERRRRSSGRASPSRGGGDDPSPGPDLALAEARRTPRGRIASLIRDFLPQPSARPANPPKG